MISKILKVVWVSVSYASRLLRSPIVLWAARLGLGGAFVWAGIVKFFYLDDFATVILVYDLVPQGLVALPAVGLPAAEILAGLATIAGRREGYWAALSLLVVFLAVLWVGILKDLDVDCSCFSLSEQAGHATLRDAFIRDWFLLAGAIYLILVRRKGK